MENEPYLVALNHGYDQTQTASTSTVHQRAKNSYTHKPTPKFGDRQYWILASLTNVTTPTLPFTFRVNSA